MQGNHWFWVSALWGLAGCANAVPLEPDVQRSGVAGAAATDSAPHAVTGSASAAAFASSAGAAAASFSGAESASGTAGGPANANVGVFVPVAGSGAEAPPSVSSVCSETQGDVAKPATQQALLDLLIGDWSLCSSSSVFCDAPAAGISIRSDGTWANFEGAGNRDSGNWTVLDTSLFNGPAAFQLNIQVQDGTVIVAPVVSRDGVHLRLDNFGACTGDYVRSGSQGGHANQLVDGVPVEALPESEAQPAADGGTCGAIATGLSRFPSPAAFENGLLGIWRQCGATSVFGSDESAVELSADQRWYKLYADNSGTLWRGVGWGRRGTWQVIDTSGVNGPTTYQLNLAIDGSGTVFTLPAISADGLHMRLNNEGLGPADYAKPVAAQAPEPTLVHGIAVEATPSPVNTIRACPMLVTAPVSLGSQAAFQSAIEGYWALCSGQSALCSSDEAGLEIASDGHWYKLYADDSGQLWRGLGWERRGSWQVIDTSAQNGTETYQLNLMIDGSGTVFGVPRLSGELGQRRMNFASACDQNGTLQGDYVQLPAP